MIHGLVLSLVLGILKREVSVYHCPPVWLLWNRLYDSWQFLFLFAKQTNPNQSNRRSTVQWYFPLKYSLVVCFAPMQPHLPGRAELLSRCAASPARWPPSCARCSRRQDKTGKIIQLYVILHFHHKKCPVGGKPTHLTSIFSLHTSVTSPHGTMLMAFADVRYGCLRMLDRLVSTHP